MQVEEQPQGEGTRVGPPEPPRARQVPVRLEHHGHVRVDEYYWLRERHSPEVVAHLEAENRYREAVLAGLRPLEEKLFEEIRGRILETDRTVPYRERSHYYYRRFETGGEYPLYCRRHRSLEAPEQVMLDANRLARGREYFQIGGIDVSPGEDLAAWAEDTVGNRIYTIRFLDLETGQALPDVIPSTTANLTWAEDNRTLLYARQDPVTLRSNRIYRHELGGDPEQDELVYEETDEAFSCWVWRSKSRRYLFIGSFQTLTSEVRFLPAGEPRAAPRLIEPRARGHEYHVDHVGNSFYIRTNLEARNFRIVRADRERPGRDHWTELVPHREDTLLEDFELFAGFLVLAERRQGLVQLRIRPWTGAGEHLLEFGEPAYLASLSDNLEPDTEWLRYRYTSLTTPPSVYDYNMATRERELRKEDPVLGGFDRRHYRTERVWATGADGTRIPVSLVYREDRREPGRNPLLLHAYGAYGISLDATFSSPRLSLLDRGFVFAIAHVRGGEELGRRWYEEGRRDRKWNTFRDYIACAEHLLEHGYGDPGRLFAMGGSAGGLLVGAVLNTRPELIRGAVADVPFVDILTSMLDESLPLTTGEYDEWGDPGDKGCYDCILSYSPYDNVRAQAYPALLVLTAFHDSQVQYWEPVKWVARLRDRRTDGNPVLLKVNMEAGHGGASGRFRRYRETALAYAFLLDRAGLAG